MGLAAFKMKVNSLKASPFNEYIKRGQRVGSHENENIFRSPGNLFSQSVGFHDLRSLTDIQSHSVMYVGTIVDDTLIFISYGREAANPCGARFSTLP